MTLRRAFFCLVMISLGLQASFTPQNQPSINWQGLEETWKKYVENQSDALLDQMLALLPDRGKAWDNVSTGAPVIDVLQKGIGILETQVYEKNPKAVRLGFRLFTIAYGSFEERLAKILGNLIGFDALLFMQELQFNRNVIPNFEVILASFRFGNSTPDEQEIERKYRIKMLENIGGKALKGIRNECLKILKKVKI